VDPVSVENVPHLATLCPSKKNRNFTQMIRSNLKYDANRKLWVTSYPWIVDPNSLPDKYSAALADKRSS
jgi:hypothetical protein